MGLTEYRCGGINFLQKSTDFKFIYLCGKVSTILLFYLGHKNIPELNVADVKFYSLKPIGLNRRSNRSTLVFIIFISFLFLGTSGYLAYHALIETDVLSPVLSFENPDLPGISADKKNVGSFSILTLLVSPKTHRVENDLSFFLPQCSLQKESLLLRC